MDAIEAINNRFKYYEELDDEDLLSEREAILQEIADLNERLTECDIDSDARRDIEDSDLLYEKEKISAVEEIMQSRGLLGPTR